MRTILLSGVLLASLTLPALADAGVPPVWDDFQPAVSTQYRPPDGGRHYRKPDTKLLLDAQVQRRLQGALSEIKNDPSRIPARSGLGSSTSPRTLRQQAPLAVPPSSSSPSAPIGSSDPLTSRPAERPGR